MSLADEITDEQVEGVFEAAKAYAHEAWRTRIGDPLRPAKWRPIRGHLFCTPEITLFADPDGEETICTVTFDDATFEIESIEWTREPCV